MRRLTSCLSLLLPALLLGCIEAVNAPLAPTARPEEWNLPQWEYQGSFGGTAELSAGSSDPWERRYEEGKFVSLRGIDANASELWACDLGISRLQVFDHSGRLLRTVGSGVVIEGTLPSDVEFYEEERNFVTGQTRWEHRPENERWVTDKHGLFKAFDIALLPNGYWISDQAQSSGMGNRVRSMAVRFYANNGVLSEVDIDRGPLWPAWLAADEQCIATCELWGNNLCLAKLNADGIWEQRRPPGGPQVHSDFRNVMDALYRNSGNPQQFFLLGLASRAGRSIGEFDYVGGLSIYQGKLLSCDRRNRRIQVFEARPDQGENWAQAIKMIAAVKYEGGSRFRSPLAIAASPEGIIYLLDGERREVAILSPAFERIGTLNSAQLEAPLDIALSTDGRQLFISDTGRNLIHRYAAR